MKKMLLLALVAILTMATSCDKDEPTPTPPPPPYYNPVEGQWKSDDGNNGRDWTIAQFTKNFERYIYIYRSNEFKERELTGKYTINNTFFTLNSKKITYRISNDTLYIDTGLQKQEWIKYKETLP